jgi:hypothetical protein
MAYTPARLWGSIGLWMLIVFDILLLSFLTWTHNWIWLSVFGGITLWIVIWEIVGVTIGFKQPDGTRKKETISTYYGEYLKRVGWKGYMALTFFLMAMIGLFIHLVAYGLK